MPEPEAKKLLCPDCGKEVDATARRCAHCDFPLVVHADLARVQKVFEKSRPQLKKQEDDTVYSWLFGK